MGDRIDDEVTTSMFRTSATNPRALLAPEFRGQEIAAIHVALSVAAGKLAEEHCRSISASPLRTRLQYAISICVDACVQLADLLTTVSIADSGRADLPTLDRMAEQFRAFERIEKALYRRDISRRAREALLMALDTRRYNWFEAAYPQFAARLPRATFDEAAGIFSGTSNAEKWKRIVELIASADMGRVSPAALAAEWRKFRNSDPVFWSGVRSLLMGDYSDLKRTDGCPEKQDLGEANPEK